MSAGVGHAVLFRFNAGTTDEQIEDFGAGLAALPTRIAQIRSYRFGPALRLVGTSWDYALVAEFDSAEDFVAYRDHPDHQAFIAERVEPLVAERASVQFET